MVGEKHPPCPNEFTLIWGKYALLQDGKSQRTVWSLVFHQSSKRFSSAFSPPVFGFFPSQLISTIVPALGPCWGMTELGATRGPSNRAIPCGEQAQRAPQGHCPTSMENTRTLLATLLDLLSAPALGPVLCSSATTGTWQYLGCWRAGPDPDVPPCHHPSHPEVYFQQLCNANSGSAERCFVACSAQGDVEEETCRTQHLLGSQCLQGSLQLSDHGGADMDHPAGCPCSHHCWLPSVNPPCPQASCLSVLCPFLMGEGLTGT
eukprot:XP_027323672.1 uncharacterized protein LOC106014640 [Anas platyrhynchos]